MNKGRISVRLALAAVLISSTGCLSRGSGSVAAHSENAAAPGRHPAMLLAAARQYEKEGRSDLAAQYYRQVLAVEPQNTEARTGLELVQSGRLREDAGYHEIVAAARPHARPQLQTQEDILKRAAEFTDQSAQMLARASTPTVRTPGEPTPASQPTVITSAAKSRPSAPAPAVAAVASPAPPHSVIPEVRPEALSAVAKLTPTDGSELVPVIVPAGKPEPREIAAGTEPSQPIRDDSTGSERVSPSLTPLCRDASPAVLSAVAKLDSEDDSERNDGLRELIELGAEAASADLPIRALLCDDAERVRAHAAWALWEISGDAANSVEVLRELLHSGSEDVVTFAAYTLCGIGQEAHTALPDLQRLMRCEDHLIQLHAAEAVARIATDGERDEAIDTLVVLTADPNPEIRTLAVVAFESVRREATPSLTTALASALHDRDPEIRATAALMLGAFGPAAKSAVAQLEFVAETDDDDVKQAAETALQCLRREADETDAN